MSDNAGFYGSPIGNVANQMQDYGNRRAEWGPASMDVRHNWISSYNYEMPIGQGASRLTHALLGGWSTSGVLTFRTGLPLTIGESPNTFWECRQRRAARPWYQQCRFRHSEENPGRRVETV